MPWILCGPEAPPESTGEESGSTAATFTAAFCDLRYRPTPVTVPPVPTPATNQSILPSVSAQISGPVVSKCALGLAGFTNWPGTKPPGICLASSSALAIAPFMPLAPSVRTSSAP